MLAAHSMTKPDDLITSQDDIEYYGLTLSKEELVCERCGKEIRPGDYVYRRYSNPVIHCVECRKDNKDRWVNNRSIYEEITKLAISSLNENGCVDLEALKNDYKLSETQINRIAKRLKDRGYIIELDIESKGSSNATSSWKIKYTPVVQDFLDSIINLEDAMKIASKYKDNAHVISSTIHELAGVDDIIQNDENQLFSYISGLIEADVEAIANTVYIERIAFDNQVYQEVIEDNRNLVMTYYVDCLFRLSKRVIADDCGVFVEDGFKKTYSVITNERDLENETGCDVDVVVSSEGIFVLINDGERICELLDYLDLTSDEESNRIINMMTGLLKRGF